MTRRPLSAALLLAAVPSVGLAQATVATYEVTFDATWSAQTHPSAFPPNAHFSPLIGGTHHAGYSLWAPGALASPGVETMAETGATGGIAVEVNAAISAGTAGELIVGPDVPISPGVAVTTFSVTDVHSLVSLTTMIAPSPDWFVGVHDVDLFAGGAWIDELELPLFAYDSGTDSGTNFLSSNSDTNPPDPIALQTGGPFTGSVALGTFTFRRLEFAARYGSGVNPADSITYVGDAPTIGDGITLQLQDPSGTMGQPSATALALSADPLPGFPGGIVLPNLGLSAPGAPGELLIDPNFLLLLAGPSYVGAPVDVTFTVPVDASLIGMDFFAQGVLVDPGGRIGLTDGVQMEVGA